MRSHYVDPTIVRTTINNLSSENFIESELQSRKTLPGKGI